MKLALILALTVASLTSCEQFKALLISNQSAIVNAVAESARVGATAGIDSLKQPAAKNPGATVQP